MEFRDKTELKLKLSKVGRIISIGELNIITKHHDDLVFKIQKDHHFNKRGIRLIYSLFFMLIIICANFFNPLGIIIIAFLYNTIHFLCDYVFYSNNFRNRNVKRKN